jgi:hypothetical protein
MRRARAACLSWIRAGCWPVEPRVYPVPETFCASWKEAQLFPTQSASAERAPVVVGGQSIIHIIR